jgi:membrane-bound lytic murein transglycosylase A
MLDFSETASKFQRCARSIFAAAVLLLVAACETANPVKPPPQSPPEAAPSISEPAPAPVVPVEPPKPAPPANGAALQPATWRELPGWREHDAAAAWSAYLASCRVLVSRDAWRNACTRARELHKPDRETARRFFEIHFTPYRVVNRDGSREGLITGYYEPLLHGSRVPSERYRHPIYGVPDDLLVVELGELYPELKGRQLRGRLEGRRVVPYYDRAAIENGKAPLHGREIAWVDDAIDLFFLQIQGSGRIELDDGRVLRVGFADQNGHPYRSIGRWLVERGELPLEKASMQGIKDWARQNPTQLAELLHYNARYVFFREVTADAGGPLGALGVPLTPRRSIAIDPDFVTLGAPVYLATTWPNSAKPLNQLVVAQDTGGAIRGAVRADFFWGFGPEAAREAGRMKQPLRMWVLLPSGYPIAGR